MNKFLCLALIITGMAWNCLAQDSTGHSGIQQNIDEVVVSGSMKTVLKKDAAIPIEVYTPAFFKKSASPTVFESLNMISGVQPQLNCNVCNTGDIHINGLEGPYTLILIDGMPIISSLATVYGLHGIPQSLIQRIEVVKGPASTLYGSEAVAGLVNIITKDPLVAPRFSADIYTTSIGEVSADVATARRISNKVSTLAGLSYFNYTLPKDRNGDNFTDVTLQHRISAFNKWSITDHANRHSSIAGRYVWEERWGGEMDYDRKRHLGTDIKYGEWIRTNRAELIGKYALPVGNEDIRLEGSYNLHRQESFYGLTKYFATQHTAFAQLVWNRKINNTDLVTGIPLRYTLYDDNTPATAEIQGQEIHNKPSETWLPGVFTQAETKWSNAVSTLMGIRYDRNSLHGNIFTPRAAVKLNAGKAHTIRLAAGSGYRIVNLFTEEHAALTGARKVVIAESLKPERSWNINANYVLTGALPKGIFTLDASIFYTRFSNQIIPDYATNANEIIYANLNGHAVSRGITLNMDAAFTNGFRINTGFTLLDVYRRSVTDGSMQQTPQLFAPKISANYAISYTLHKAKLTIDYTGKITSPMHLPVLPNDYRPEMSPWFCIMNIQVTKKMGAHYEVYAGVKNLLDFMPGDPLMRPYDPFDKNVNDPVNNPNGYTFDTQYNYAPLQGARAYAGLRISF